MGTRYCKFTHHQISSVSLYLHLLLLYASLEKHVIINQVRCFSAFYHCLTLLMKCNRNEIIENIMKYLVLFFNLYVFISHLDVCMDVCISLCVLSVSKFSSLIYDTLHYILCYFYYTSTRCMFYNHMSSLELFLSDLLWRILSGFLFLRRPILRGVELDPLLCELRHLLCDKGEMGEGSKILYYKVCH